MDFIRQQWNLIQERLAGLTASQKMLVGALVVITIMTMLYWGRFASGREMVALSATPMSAEEVAMASASLRARGITFTANGGTIMVAADSRDAAMSDLSFNQALPTTPNFFESMIKDVSPFDTQAGFDARKNNARERELAKMIAGWPDVKGATVLIQDNQQRGIGRFEPRATVNIVTRSGSGVKKLAQSATMTVLGAVSGLNRANVSVMIDGQAMSNSSDAVGVGNEVLDIIRQFEASTAEKIRGTFTQFCPTIVVSVTADVDTESKKEVKETFDPKNKVVTPIDETTDTMTSTEAAPTGEPGLIANGGLDASAAAAQLPGSTSEKTTTKNQVSVGRSQLEIVTPAGKARCIGAAVRVPRSYFTKIWRAKNHKSDGEPSDAEYAAIFAAESAYMRGEVKNLTNIIEDASISVAEFPDTEILAVGPDTATGGVQFLASSYAKEGAIGVLAVASLFMVSRIVKKSVPAPTVAIPGIGTMSLGAMGGAPATGKNKGPTQLVSDEDIAGDVAEAGQVLMGQELDPVTLETAQMVEQVSKYVKDNPDTAAALVRRLMSRD